MINYSMPTRTQELNAYYHIQERIQKNPSYSDCIIGRTWQRDHERFYTWYRNNYYTLPDDEKINLDKDILVPDNRIYSEDTCLLVPESVNKFFIGIRGTGDNNLPVGVTLNKKSQKYVASITENGKTKRLGSFSTPAEAHNAWASAKKEQLRDLIEKYNDVVPSEVTEAMGQWLDYNI